jgi:hypothetical protein
MTATRKTPDRTIKGEKGEGMMRTALPRIKAKITVRMTNMICHV